MRNPKTYFVETYGCQMNVSDSEFIGSLMDAHGFVCSDSLEDADIIIVNTCSVRKHAEDRALGRLSAMKNLMENGAPMIGVCGCMAQRMGKDLVDSIPHLSFVVGTDCYGAIPDVIDRVVRDQTPVVLTDVNHSEQYHLKTPRSRRASAFVSIMRGCNNFCTYCIVPLVRGRERSKPWLEIRDEIMACVEAGAREVTLLGQNVNSYAQDSLLFPDILEKANGIEGLERIRFLTSHPKDLSDELIRKMRELDKICEQIHLPLQSGSDRVLSGMGRGYTRSHYLGLINKLRDSVKDIAISTDILVGFPGESDRDFEDTLRTMESAAFESAFVFKYSVREGTRAAELPDDVPEELKLERLRRVNELQCELSEKHSRSLVTTRQEVLVEGESKLGEGQLRGRTRSDKMVVFHGSPQLVGREVLVDIRKLSGRTLVGEIADPESGA
jgi:tRNA-2-methylthio-N6-dimethylallyladenosine synthase